MIWPTISTDNFFPNLEGVIKFAKSLPYTAAKEGSWPGERTELLSRVDTNFFNYSTSKMVALLYPQDWRTMRWSAISMFQRIKGTWQGEGWVHQDDPEISCIVYLEGDENCGTSLVKQLTQQTVAGQWTGEKLQKIRRAGNLSPKKFNTKKHQEARDKNNKKFKKTVSFDSVPNRCVIFDAKNYHKVDNYNNSENNTRLTLITFFRSIIRGDGSQVKYHAAEAKRL